MEYCGNGDLGGYIKGLVSRGEWAEEGFVWGVFAQLVGALYRCHYGVDPPAAGEEGRKVPGGGRVQSKAGHRVILHRDLKPENGELEIYIFPPFFLTCPFLFLLTPMLIVLFYQTTTTTTRNIRNFVIISC